MPFEQTVVGANSLVVRTVVDPASVAAAIRDKIWEVDKKVPISDVRTMDDLFSGSLQRQRMTLTLFAVFAGIAIGLGLSALLSGYMRGMIYGVPATDPATFVAVAIILLLVAAGASWIPARTAARADPCIVLRDLPD